MIYGFLLFSYLAPSCVTNLLRNKLGTSFFSSIFLAHKTIHSEDLRSETAILHSVSSCYTRCYMTSGAGQLGFVPYPLPWHPWLSLLRNTCSMVILRIQPDPNFHTLPFPSPLPVFFSVALNVISSAPPVVHCTPLRNLVEGVGTNVHTHTFR